MSYRSLSADSLRKGKITHVDHNTTSQPNQLTITPNKVIQYISKAHSLYNQGQYQHALELCEACYELDACRTDNLLLLGAIHFQLRNYSESVFYNQQCIRVDGNFAEAYSNLGNALKELGDLNAAIQFYMKVCAWSQCHPYSHGLIYIIYSLGCEA
jgi:tetratricopeptide (TPR) repeat protein